MFLLPNGDVFYAGGEGASEENSKGRVLIPGYNNGGTWTWDEREFTSQINGGSAVMYEPGKIMKSGGLCRGCENDSPAIKDQDNIAVAKTEAIDLSGFASGDYGAATNFLAKGDMNQPRHFHNLTLLPDGRVLATGGNKRDNGQVGDYWRNACDYQSAAIADMDNCNDQDHNGVPDNPATAYEGCPAVRSPCSYYDPDGVGGLDPGNYCPLRGNTDCDQLGTVYCGAPCEDNDECPPGSICDCPTEEPCGMQQKYCQMPCPENPMSTCGAVVHCSGGGSFCDPAKNECHATQTAEIYEPGCGAWTELDAEERPRMYHSTALLLPGGEVYSMGGGHRPPLVEQNSAQIFRPEYGAPGTASAPQIHVIPETEKYNSNKPTLTADGAQVMFDNGSASIVAERFSLLRLGSVTHQFDMDQRFMWLNITDGAHDAANVLTVESPYLQGDLPPGYYMLFLRTEEGEVSTGEYVRVPLLDSQSTVWVCPATLDLTATHTSCTVEPIDGECPFGEEQIDPVDLPLVDSAPGPVEGWHVFTPIGEVDDPLAPTARELASLDARCVAACQAHFASDPSFTANCDGVDVFGPPEPFYNGAPGPYHLVLPGQEHGEGVFAGESVACALGSTCCAAFDEELCAAAPERATPANDLLGVGQEFGLALGVSSTIQVVTDQGTYGSTLTGSTGYSFCSDGNDTAPCPFYLGSFEALATSGITASMTCADSSVAHPRLTNLSLKLSQPAFGIAQEGTDLKGFPKGALVFESAFDVDTQHFTTRGPTHADVIVTAAGTTFDATDLTVTLQVPCNTSTAAITVKVSAHSSSTGALGRPPVVTNTTAATGTCGVSRALTATVSDPDSDAGPVRWRVDGVWLAPGTSAMIITEPHVLEAIVRDARGATTTATKEVSCN